MTAWTCKIRPFKDDLTKTIDWLFYWVPDNNPAGPPTVFTDRFWDEREHWVPETVGVVPGSMRPYFGPIPNRPPGPPSGDPDWWVNGVLYSVYASGGYTDPVGCWPVVKPSLFFKIRQSQEVFGPNPMPWGIFQVQNLRRGGFARTAMRQAQAARAPGHLPVAISMSQAQDLHGNGAFPTVFVSQAQSLRVAGGTRHYIRQAQDLRRGVSSIVDLQQAQTVYAVGQVGTTIILRQAQSASAPEEPHGRHTADMAQAQVMSEGFYPVFGQAQGVTSPDPEQFVRQAQDVTA